MFFAFSRDWELFFHKRIIVGFLLLLGGLTFGMMPVLDPVGFTPKDFPNETLQVERILVGVEEIHIYAKSPRHKVRLFAQNHPSRASRIAAIQPGDEIRAWFAKTGYIWQLEHRGQFVIPITERNSERQEEVRESMLVLDIVLSFVGLLIVFTSRRDPSWETLA